MGEKINEIFLLCVRFTHPAPPLIELFEYFHDKGLLQRDYTGNGDDLNFQEIKFSFFFEIFSFDITYIHGISIISKRRL